MGGAGSGFDLGIAQRPAHRDVVAHVGGEQKRLLRHQADGGAKVVVADVGNGQAVDAQRARRRGVEAQQQRQQGAFAAAGGADDADELARRYRQAQVVQHHGPGRVGKVQALDRDRAGADPAGAGGLRRLGLVHQGVDPRGGDHRLLQLRELHRDLDQWLDHPGDVADEGIQHAHLQRVQATAAQAVDPDHGGQHRHVQEVQRRAQQPGVGAQLVAPGLVVGRVGGRKALVEGARRAAGLDQGHAGNRLAGLGVDVAAQRAAAGHRRGRQALVEPDDADHRRHQQGHDQHQPPVQPGHHHQHAGQHHQAVEHHEQELHVQRFDRLGVVGDAADQLAGDGAVKKCHWQAHHVGVDTDPDALHRSHRHPGQVDQLAVAQHAGQAAADPGAAQQGRHLQQLATGHQLVRQQVAVDEELAQRRAGGFQRGGQHQPGQGALQDGQVGHGSALQQGQGGAAGVGRVGGFRLRLGRAGACGQGVSRAQAKPPVAAPATGSHTSRPGPTARGGRPAR